MKIYFGTKTIKGGLERAKNMMRIGREFNATTTNYEEAKALKDHAESLGIGGGGIYLLNEEENKFFFHFHPNYRGGYNFGTRN